MAQLDKMLGQLLEQREAKQAALDQVPPAAPAEPPAEPPAAPAKAKPATTSKRSSWKVCTFYLPAETKARLKRVLFDRQETGAGGAADQSEAINEALLAWLEKAEREAM
jgi:hypothetical protein